MKLKKTFFILSIIVSFIAFAQKGKIAGKIVDKRTNEDLIGANVMLEGTKNVVSTDIEGRYLINVEPGTYTIVISYVSYKSKKIQDVVVKSGEVTNVNTGLEEDSKELGEVEIVATFEKESQALILTERKNAAQVSDGISAEVIRKTPDRTSSDVLKRITGVSIQDNKFAIVRGLADRYNAAFINGAPLPSTESDRKAFAFDMFPAQLLESMTILKTATPDMVGDWAGGVINIKTRDVPDKPFFKIGVSGTHNSITTFKPYQTYKGGSTDWLGLDDGTRELPSELVSPVEITSVNRTKQDNLEMSQKIADQPFNDWAMQQRSSAAPNMNIQASAGTAYNFNEKNKLGVIAAITYNNSRNFNVGDRNTYDEVQEFAIKNTENRNNILSGAMLNLTGVIQENHKISFKNIANINSEDRVTQRDIQKDFSNGFAAFTSTGINRWYTQNIMTSSQLSGEHFIESLLKSKIKWTGSYSLVDRNIPSMRYSEYQRTPFETREITQDQDGNDIEVVTGVTYKNIANVNNGGGPSKDNHGFIFNSRNKEKIYSFGADYSIQIPTGNLKTEFKAGGYYQLREREFNARQYGWARYQVVGGGIQFDQSLLQKPVDSIFIPQNIGALANGKGGFIMDANPISSDTYTASSRLRSGFAMFDNRIDVFRFIWGARFESYNQKLSTFTSDGKIIGIDETINDILPSANFIYEVNDKSNLRISYSKTVSRPEFRELAPFSFFDYSLGFETAGNEKLVRTKVTNLDLRYEYFPGAGQVIAVTGFYKHFDNPIEQFRRGFNRLYSYINAPNAFVMGLEFEYRQNIGNLVMNVRKLFNSDATESKILSRITPFMNYSYIISDVNTSNIPGTIEANRPLQGQSPYVFNAGAQYQDEKKGYSFGFTFNQIGRRIFIVGATGFPTIWENPRPVLDFNATKSFLKDKLEIRFSAGDLIAYDYIFYSDMNGDGEFNEVSSYIDAKGNYDFQTKDLVVIRNNAGRNIRLGLMYSF